MFKREGTSVHIQLIQFVVQQKHNIEKQLFANESIKEVKKIIHFVFFTIIFK